VSRESRRWFGEVVRDPDGPLDLACLLIAAEALPDAAASGTALREHVEDGLARLDDLAAAVPATGRPDQRLRHVLGAFAGDAQDYLRLDSSLLPDVLARRRGLPILLSTVWTEVARRVGIDAYGVGLPGHFVVAVGDPTTFDPALPDGSRLLVDPWRGGVLLPYDRARDLVEGVGQVFRREQLAPMGRAATLARMLANVRAWAARPERAPARLWATELALLLPQAPPGLVRERAEALLECGGHLAAAAAFEQYAGAVATARPDEAHEALVRARQARAHLN